MKDEEQILLADHLVVLQYYGEKHLINNVLLLPMIVIEFGTSIYMWFFHSTIFMCILPYDCSDNHDDYMFYLSEIF